MALNAADVIKVAHLARLAIQESEIPRYAKELSNILDLVAKMSAVNTAHIKPTAHSLDLTQPLRADDVTEPNQRALFQSIAPAVEAGLYLVPKVIE